MRQDLREVFARDVHAQDGRGDLLHQLRREAEALGLEGGIADGLGTERVEVRGQMAVGPEGLDEGGAGGNGREKVLVGRHNGSGRGGCRSGLGRRGVAVLGHALALEQPRKAGVRRDELAVAALEDVPPFLGDRFRILEVLLEQEPGVSRVQSVDFR